MGKRRYKQVADTIAERINSGEYKIGERLPSERELAESFSVGRPILREAFVALELFGLVEVRHGSGVTVLPWQNQPLKVNIFDHGVNPFELIDARRIIECEVAAAAAMIISDRELFELQRLIQKMRDSYDDLGAYYSADIEFHTVVVKSARNVALKSIVDSLWALHSRGKYYDKLSRFKPGPKLLGERLDEHTAIYDALARRDPDDARDAMDAHLKRAKGTLLAAAEQLRAEDDHESSRAEAANLLSA